MDRRRHCHGNEERGEDRGGEGREGLKERRGVRKERVEEQEVSL